MQVLDNDYEINVVNVLQKFKGFQSSIGAQPLTYKCHIQHMLATSGILLVTKHLHPDVLKFVEHNTGRLILKGIQERVYLSRKQIA